MSDAKKFSATMEIILNLLVAACSTIFLSSKTFRTNETIFGVAAALLLLALKNVYRAWREEKQRTH